MPQTLEIDYHLLSNCTEKSWEPENRLDPIRKVRGLQRSTFINSPTMKTKNPPYGVRRALNAIINILTINFHTFRNPQGHPVNIASPVGFALIHFDLGPLDLLVVGPLLAEPFLPSEQ